MLSQKEIDELLEILKHIEYDQSMFAFPQKGEKEVLTAYSLDKRTMFLIDITPGKSRNNKISFQERYKKDVILLRLDMNGPPHTNPDGEKLSGNHLHIAREGYDDRFAIEVPERLIDEKSRLRTLINFLEYCKIDNPDFASFEMELIT